MSRLLLLLSISLKLSYQASSCIIHLSSTFSPFTIFFSPAFSHFRFLLDIWLFYDFFFFFSHSRIGFSKKCLWLEPLTWKKNPSQSIQSFRKINMQYLQTIWKLYKTMLQFEYWYVVLFPLQNWKCDIYFPTLSFISDLSFKRWHTFYNIRKVRYHFHHWGIVFNMVKWTL